MKKDYFTRYFILIFLVLGGLNNSLSAQETTSTATETASTSTTMQQTTSVQLTTTTSMVQTITTSVLSTTTVLVTTIQSSTTTTSIYAQFIFNELIYNNAPAQGMDMHSFYDGQYIWYPEHNNDDNTNNLIQFNPTDDSIIVYRLADYVSDNNPIAYHAIADPLDSNTIWVWAPYGTHSLWKFNKTTRESIYISGKDKVAGAGFGGKITRFTQLDGTSRIWGSLVFGSSPVAYDEDTNTYTHYTMHTDIPGVTGASIEAYGLQSNDKNLFLCGSAGDNGYIYAVHNNFTTDGTVTLSGAIQATYIKSSDVVTHTSVKGESYTDLAWDGTYLWASGGDATSNKIYRIQPVFDNGYVTSFGEATIYDTGNGWVSLAPSIKANDKYVMAVWEAASLGRFGGLLINKTNNFATWNFAGDDVNIYPFVEEYWPTVTVEIDAPGAIYITGYYPDGQGWDEICPNKSMRILKMTTRIESTSTTTEPNTTTIQESTTTTIEPTTSIMMPSCAGVSPASAEQGVTREVTIVGLNTNFSDGATVASFSGSGITVYSTKVKSTTEAVATISIDPDATLGARDMTATTGTELATCMAVFTVAAAQVTTTAEQPTTTTTSELPITSSTTSIQPSTSSTSSTTMSVQPTTSSTTTSIVTTTSVIPSTTTSVSTTTTSGSITTTSQDSTTTSEIITTSIVPKTTTTSIGGEHGGGGGGGGGGSTTTIININPSTVPVTSTIITTTISAPPPPECTIDVDCDDGIFCNGMEKCRNGSCEKGVNPCDAVQICRENTAQCWSSVSVTGLCMQNTVLRPIIRAKKYPWLFVYCQEGNHFIPGLSTIEVVGSGLSFQGVTIDTRRKAVAIGKLIIIPVCIEKGASTGRWNIKMKTEIANAAVEENIITNFQVQ
jgi:hypothetical protein